VTSQKAQIQALLNEIDSVLNKATPRLPWVMSGDVENQRRVLEQTRQYLASLEQQMTTAEQYGGAMSVPGTYGPPQMGGYGGSAAEPAQQILQAVLQEMNYLRTHVMQPLRADIDEMQQRREALAQEIRLLEAQKQQYALSANPQNQQQVINEFLQSLMGQLQEHLTGQVAQMLSSMEAQIASDRSALTAGHYYPPGSANILPEGMPPYQPMLTPAQRLEHLQQLQAQSDQLMLKLDSTLRVIFDSLQSNVQTYQESLSQGIDKMHNLGQQGEAMFAALINRLAQLLGREASTYLQSSWEADRWDAGHSLPGLDATNPNAPVAPSFQPSASAPNLDTPDLGALELPDLDLSNVNLEPSPQPFDDRDRQDEERTIFQMDEAAAARSAARAEADDEELTIFQVGEGITTHIQENDELAPIDDLETLEDESQEDLDALDLLNQLTTIQVDEDVMQEATATESGDDPEDETPENLYGELNDLYESMFGITGGESSVEEEEGEPPVDQHIADANQRPPEESTEELQERLFEEPITMVQSDAEQESASGATNATEVLADYSWDEQTEDLEAIEDGLLDSLDESAQAGATPDLDPTRAAMADSIESLLFSETGAASDAETATSQDAQDIGADWFWQDEESLEEEPIAFAETETEPEQDIVESLADLAAIAEDEIFPSAADADLANMLHQTEGEGWGDTGDDEHYIPASPEENLLDTEEEVSLEQPSQSDFRLTAGTLQQLTTDLSNLEGLDEEDLFSASEMLAMEGDNLPFTPPTASPVIRPEEEIEAEAESASPLPDAATSRTEPSKAVSEAIEEIVADADLEQGQVDWMLDVFQPEEGAAEKAVPPEESGSEEPVTDLAALLDESDLSLPPEFPPDLQTALPDDVSPPPLNLDDLFGDDVEASADPAAAGDTSWSSLPEDELSLDSFMADEAVPLDESTSLPEADMLNDMADTAPPSGEDEESLSLEDFGVAMESAPSTLPVDMSGATNLADLFGEADVAEEPHRQVEQIPMSSPKQSEMKTADGVSIGELFAVDEQETGSVNSEAFYSAEVNAPEDLFGGMGAPMAGEVPPEPSPAQEPSEPESEAFTLEGLGQLFEDLPDTEPATTPAAPPSADAEDDNFTVEDAFGGLFVGEESTEGPYEDMDTRDPSQPDSEKKRL
jgi:hypothetical protein